MGEMIPLEIYVPDDETKENLMRLLISFGPDLGIKVYQKGVQLSG